MGVGRDANTTPEQLVGVKQNGVHGAGAIINIHAHMQAVLRLDGKRADHTATE